jgi:hypothetical protein
MRPRPRPRHLCRVAALSSHFQVVVNGWVMQQIEVDPIFGFQSSPGPPPLPVFGLGWGLAASPTLAHSSEIRDGPTNDSNSGSFWGETRIQPLDIGPGPWVGLLPPISAFDWRWPLVSPHVVNTGTGTSFTNGSAYGVTDENSGIQSADTSQKSAAISPGAFPIAHKINTGSNGRACHCGKAFSRKDALARHIRAASHRSTRAMTRKTGPQESSELYPCNLCDKHQGCNGFKRRDHLRQHLGVKGYHKMTKAAVDRYLEEYH